MRLPSLFHPRGGGALLAGLLLGAGCRSTPPPSAAPAQTRNPVVVGEIAVVDEEKRFVLVDLESNLYVPAPGSLLRSRNAAGETAQLQASPEQKRPFIAADIVDGDPAVGDQVVR
ncbi:MAG: hypothetical protein ABIR38_05305 [Chthoniobacterales bacterium]